jgi:hypothetical protein
MVDVANCMGKELGRTVWRRGGRNQKQKQKKTIDGTKPTINILLLVQVRNKKCTASIFGRDQSLVWPVLRFAGWWEQGDIRDICRSLICGTKSENNIGSRMVKVIDLRFAGRGTLILWFILWFAGRIQKATRVEPLESLITVLRDGAPSFSIVGNVQNRLQIK